MAGQPFIAFEWGSEVVYALAYRAAGLPGVAVLAGLVLALTYALVARFLLRRGGDPLLAYFVSIAAAVLSAAHWLPAPTCSPCWRQLLRSCSSGAAGELRPTLSPTSGPIRTASSRVHRYRHLRGGEGSRRGHGRARGAVARRATTRPRWARAGGEHRQPERTRNLFHVTAFGNRFCGRPRSS
jgi:hypothetical protein